LIKRGFRFRIDDLASDIVAGGFGNFRDYDRVGVIITFDQWFELDLTDLTTKSGTIAAYSTPCATTLTTEQALKEIANYFDRYGFDVRALEELITSTVPSEP